MEYGLEVKFAVPSPLSEGQRIEGYASRFGLADQGGDVVARGAFAASLAAGGKVRMLWQHDPAHPIGVWDELREDATGLWVKGRLLPEVAQAREAAALVAAGAVDGLSIGYRVKRSGKDGGGRRLLTELELWEVSLVTFPMLPSATVRRREEGQEKRMAAIFAGAAEALRLR